MQARCKVDASAGGGGRWVLSRIGAGCQLSKPCPCHLASEATVRGAQSRVTEEEGKSRGSVPCN